MEVRRGVSATLEPTRWATDDDAPGHTRRFRCLRVGLTPPSPTRGLLHGGRAARASAGRGAAENVGAPAAPRRPPASLPSNDAATTA